MSCPNVNSQQWKDLVAKIGVREAYREFSKNANEIPNAEGYQDTFKGVNTTLKVIGALNTPKMDQVYTKFYSGNPDKFYAELLQNGATKEQVQMLRQLNEQFNPQSLGDMITGIAAEMSYTVEIKEATSGARDYYIDNQQWGDGPITEDEQKEYDADEQRPTQIYSNMVVPGGTNYRENEIRTPDIIPVRQGHAQFSTENGIGWFRSDDKSQSVKVPTEDWDHPTTEIVGSKTRRILEIQSDLFQKMRNSDTLISSGDREWLRMEHGLSDEEADNRLKQDNKKNDFLQLLNKENNWVNFFVKSIIQDSTRKGYEEVLFPSGATAAKVEGHETLEQFLANSQRHIGELQVRLEPGALDPWFNHRVKGIEDAAASNRKSSQEKPPQLNSSTDHFISPKLVDSNYEFVRVRENHYNERTPNETLTGDSYKGWVLYEYTVGRGNNITKISDERAQHLIAENHATITTKDRLEAERQEESAAWLKSNKESVLDTERENITREIGHINQEMEDARNGRAQLSSIASFYENTIQNILNKQKYGPERVTDAYGNEWFRVKLRDDYKDTIYFNKDTETPHTFEQRATAYLQKEGLINTKQETIGGKKEWVVRRTQIGSYDINTNKVVSILGLNVSKLRQVSENYYAKYGFNPFTLRQVSGKTWVVDINKQTTLFNKDSIAIENAREYTGAMLDHLRSKMGLDYEVINADRARELLGNEYDKMGDDYDNSIKGFYMGDKVYLMEDSLTPDNAFHEYAHPFVRALSQSNPELFNNLVTQLRRSSEGNAIYNSIQGLYTSHVDEEAVVRAMTQVAIGDMSFQSPEGKSFWSRLWFNVKQFFRKMFGQNIDLSKLDEKTSLSSLSEMLLGTKAIKQVQGKPDYVMFNREIAKEMTNIPEHASMKAIETFHRVAQDHLSKMRENMNYNGLREVLKNQADGSMLQDINKLLSLSKQKEGEMDDNFKKLTNFSRAVVGARILSEKMKTHVAEMNAKDMDEKDKLRTMRYYSFISNDWLHAFDQLREVNRDDLPLLGDEIARASNNFRRINDHISEAFKGGLVSTLRDQLAPLSENVQKELGPELERLKEEVKTNPKLQPRLDYVQKMYDHGTFDDAKILRMLQGELGDTNWASAVLESYTSSPDAVVGGFGAYINKQFYKVEAGIQEFSTNLGNELAPHYKQLGVDTSNPEALGHQLVFKNTAFTKDEEGKPKGHEVYEFLHEFANGYNYDYQNLQHQLDEAKEGGDKEKSIKLQQELNQLKKDYFHREYVDDVYNAKEFWNESDINRLAQQRRKEITDQLSSYEAESGFKDLTEDDRNHIDELLTQLKTLSSTKNLDGTDKTGDDLGVAQAIKEYNSRMSKFREEIAMKGAFERDMQSQKDDLLDKGYTEDSQEYKDGLNAWLKNNLRVRLSDQFYDSRNKITDEIASIVSKLDQDQAKGLDVSNSWKEMFEQLKGFRDQDNQPMGTELSKEKLAQIKKLQEKINDITATLRRLNGLTNQEQSRYSELWGKVIAGNSLDAGESAEYNDLVNRKKLLGLTPVDKARLMSLFEELKQFQSKIPTEYYIDAFNQKLNESKMEGEINMLNAGDYLNAQAIDQFFEQSPDLPFTKWFKDNHISKVSWDPSTQQNKLMYERLYAWNRIVPNDDNFKNALATNDYQRLLDLKNPLVEVRPASKYFFYRIKNEYRTKKTVGQTVDNKGNWLPRTLQQGAKDGKYINDAYYKLKNDPNQKALYNILETYKKYHLSTQEDSPKYTRLWMEIPRVRKEKVENLQDLANRPVNAAKSIISWGAAMIGRKSKADAFDMGIQSRKDMEKQNKMYVATDLFGNEINSIPMKYMSKLDTSDVSMDVGRSVVKYALAQQINKALQDINPFAQALKQTLTEEGIKSTNKMSTKNWGSKFMNIPVLDRSNVRLKAITNMIERDIEGIENHMELGLFGSKMAQHLMGLSAFGSLALNIPAGIKNVVTAKLQNLTESNSKEFLGGPKNLAKADNIFMKRFMPKLIHDYNSFAGRSLETQMFELFDFVQGKFEEHVGESFSASYKKDIAKLRFTRSFQTLGELQAQGQAGIAMLLKQQVPWHHDGQTTMINYLDAWELRNGAIQLKQGVDERWGKNGDDFAGFKLKMHKLNELMQGAYAKMNQAEASRYTAFKMFNFMRRYLVPGIVNRFTVNRNNIALGTQREGYYATTARLGLDVVKNGLANWHQYSDKEKRNVWKTATEMGYSLAFLALISAMGYSANDPDKNKKLKNNSWAENMALYELVMIKGEVENFIPIPGMGFDEILRMKDQPSIAFPVLNKYYKIISHLIDAAKQPFSDYDLTHYQTSSGIYKKGDLRLIADLLKLVGYTGATVHPDNAIKNYMATTNRYN